MLFFTLNLTGLFSIMKLFALIDSFNAVLHYEKQQLPDYLKLHNEI